MSARLGVPALLIATFVASACGGDPDSIDSALDDAAGSPATDSSPHDAKGDACFIRAIDPGDRVVCRSNRDCPGSYCSMFPAGGRCIDCTGDDQCPSGERCLATTIDGATLRSCVQPCVTDADCTGILDRCADRPEFAFPHCLEAECDASCGCPEGYVCTGVTCVRRSCAGDGCPEGWPCSADGLFCLEPE